MAKYFSRSFVRESTISTYFYVEVWDCVKNESVILPPIFPKKVDTHFSRRYREDIERIDKKMWIRNPHFHTSCLILKKVDTFSNIKLSTLCRKITQKLSTNFRKRHKRQTAHLLHHCIITLKKEPIGVVFISGVLTIISKHAVNGR